MATSSRPIFRSGANDEVRLLDFGIAKAITFTHSRTHMGLGSPSYCSPERLSRGQVDRHADLWAVGVTLYEMVAGVPPYQAQDTRKLEALIQSRRPPRALPEGCPDAMTAILHKALAGDLHQRYVSAAAFESDCEAVPARPADRGRNGAARFVEEQSDCGEAALAAFPAARDQHGRDGAAKRAEAEAAARTAARIGDEHFGGAVLGTAGGPGGVRAAGILLSILARERALRGNLDYSRASVGDINGDWDLLQRVQRQNAFLGEISPAMPSGGRMCDAALLQAGDEVIEGYRNNSDPRIQDFDWPKAEVCFTHLIEMDRNDRSRARQAGACVMATRIWSATEACRRRPISKKPCRCCRVRPIRTWGWRESMFIR